MASNSRVRPLSYTSRVRPIPYTSLVRPLVYSGSAVSAVTVNDTNHLAWITHLDNPAMTATITATTASTVYPKSNLQVLPITAVWRSVGVAAAQDLEFDFGSSQQVDILALVNHNLTSAATIAVAAGTTTSYADFSTTITWREFISFKRLSTPENYRYWRIRITDTANTDGFIEVGYPVVGLLVKPQFSFQQGWISATDIATSKVKSEFGNPTVEKLYQRQRLELPFGPLDSSQSLVMRALYTSTRRNVYPLLILPTRGGTDAYFGRIWNFMEERVEFYRYMDLQFIEDSYGERIKA